MPTRVNQWHVLGVPEGLGCEGCTVQFLWLGAQWGLDLWLLVGEPASGSQAFYFNVVKLWRPREEGGTERISSPITSTPPPPSPPGHFLLSNLNPRPILHPSCPFSPLGIVQQDLCWGSGKAVSLLTLTLTPRSPHTDFSTA